MSEIAPTPTSETPSSSPTPSVSDPSSCSDVCPSSSPSSSIEVAEGVETFTVNYANRVCTEEEKVQFEERLKTQGETTKYKQYFLTKFETDSVRNWDKFYKRNENRFFKDRHYLHTEFKELIDLINNSAAAADDTITSSSSASSSSSFSSSASSSSTVSSSSSNVVNFLEIGCGVGNTLVPLFERFESHPHINFYGFDCSRQAIASLESHEIYKRANAANRMHACVHDITLPNTPWPFCNEPIMHWATLIFVLSAIHPDKFHTVLSGAARALQPKKGILYIRDYALYDLSQLRFTKENKLGDRWYIRTDGTRSYFFTLEELSATLTAAGFKVLEAQYCHKQIVNRKQNNEMRRVFVQVKAQANL